MGCRFKIVGIKLDNKWILCNKIFVSNEKRDNKKGKRGNNIRCVMILIKFVIVIVDCSVCSYWRNCEML